MSERTLRRVAPVADLEIRSTGDGRTISGLACPFDSPTRVADHGLPFTEVFRAGAFTRTIAERGSKVKLLVQHNRSELPVGAIRSLTEAADGLRVEFHLSNTPRGDEILELIRDEALDGLSISFRPIKDHVEARSDVVERIEVALTEISVVTFPAYDGARIDGIRSTDTEHISTADARARLARTIKG